MLFNEAPRELFSASLIIKRRRCLITPLRTVCLYRSLIKSYYEQHAQFAPYHVPRFSPTLVHNRLKKKGKRD